MKIEFVASFSPIVDDIASARRFYGEDLGIDFEGGEDEYAFTEQLDGAKHLGLWPTSRQLRTNSSTADINCCISHALSPGARRSPAC